MRIAINGCGVAGPALAWWLLRAGHEPMLFEAAPELRTGGYVIDFWGLGYTIAERMGLLPRLHELGYLVGEVRLVDARGRRTSSFTTEVFRDALDGRFSSLPRGDIAAALYDALGGRVETRFGTSVTAIDAHADGVHVGLSDGSAQDFDLVVGADGLHSKVRELAFGPQTAFEHGLGYHVAAFNVSGYRPRDELVYVSHGAPGRQISRFSLRGDRTLFLFVFTDAHLGGAAPESLAARKAALARVFDGVGWEWPKIRALIDDADDFYFDRVSQIRMDHWTSGRVALVGDAAACASLLAGEGTGLAMTEAYVFAGELARAGGDHVPAFAAYERRLQGFLAGKQKSAEKFATAFAPRTPFGLWFRDLVVNLMRFRPIAERFMLADLRDDLELPDYDWPKPAT